MQDSIQSETLAAPRPEQFGLTEKRTGHFRRATEPNLLIILVAVGLNIAGSAYLVNFVFPNASVPGLLLLVLSLVPGFIIGIQIDERRRSIAQKAPDYRNYVDYCRALASYQEQLKNRNELVRKIRREEIRRRRTQQNEERRKQEWWTGVDGRGFELAVAKILMDKGYNVRHTGSSYGDEGVDLELKLNGRRIIIQCKAYRTYVSAGFVRELYGTLTHLKADEGWLVVTSGFYRGAREFAQGKPIRLYTARDLTRLPTAGSTERL